MSWKDDNPEHSASSVQGEQEDELFVFGYGCKIFRDDEKAAWVDQGHHLIPLMGDPESGLLIDRYDARGALSLIDLKRYEPPPGGANYLEGLTAEELRIEKLCDEERYRDMGDDDEEDEDMKLFYQETGEVMGNGYNGGGSKSGTKKEFGSVGYVYNDTPAEIGPEPKKLQDEIPYVPPPNLAIPEEVLLPTTMKAHAIIEKTAKFIASQGTQMEIILKTKQAKNPLFDFLAHSDPLNPYYKYLVHAIKTNMYKPPDEIPYPDDSAGSDGSDNSSDDEGGYLHPSLMKPSADITKFIPAGSFKPSLNCAYSMLVSKIKEFTAEANPVPSPPPASEATDAKPAVGAAATSASQPPQQPVQATPSPQDQLIIEKMANYVVKNGPDFEMMAKTKGDPRFAFLDSYHPYNWYYLQCKEKCTVEAQAVVASKGFVRYSDNSSSSTSVSSGALQSQSQPPVVTAGASSKINAPTGILQKSSPSTDEMPRKSAVINRVRKESIKPKSDKVIKLSLPNFTSVLRQQSAEDDGENIKKEGEECKEVKEEEDEARKKEERRKKAALFLQRLKKSEPLQAQTNVATVVDLTSDVESIPSPSSVSREESRIPDIGESYSSSSRTAYNKQSSTDRAKEIDISRHDSRRHERSRSRTKDSSDRDYKSRSRRRSLSSSNNNIRRRKSRSSEDRSRSTSSSSSSSSSYSSRRKKSKRKHSRKRHKKRERSKSTKKSKKRRR